MTLRPIAARRWGDISPNKDVGERPRAIEVDPATLLVDESYQRELGRKSVGLIRAATAAWKWSNFKPPVVSLRKDGKMVVIDGQHTAIAAASNPHVGKILVLIVEAQSKTEEAIAFVGQNLNRVNLTPMAIHHAKVAAGDEEATAIAKVCERAGVKILGGPPAEYRPGDTVSLKIIGRLIFKRGEAGAKRVLQVLVRGRCAPITRNQIMAVDELLHGDDYRGKYPEDGIVAAFIRDQTITKKGEIEALKAGVKPWLGLVRVIASPRRAA